MIIKTKDRETLRYLASRYMSYAITEKNDEKRELWKALNDMHMKKPMLNIEQIPWDEMDVDGFLTCTVENTYFRNVERTLRRLIYKWEHMPVDMVLNPYIILPHPVSNSGFGIKKQNVETNSNGHIYINLFQDQLVNMEDIEKIKTPVLHLNPDKEEEILAAAHEIFDGIAPFKWGGMIVNSGLWDHISTWKGVENCYIDLIDQPELIHAILDRYTNAHIALIDQINELGVYDTVSNMYHCSYTFTDKAPSADFDPDHTTTYDGWTWSQAQLFTSVSPEINEEFEVPYMSKLFSRYGSVYYGCCERLDDRLDIISRMPNIRKVSCSPWSDRENFAATLPKKYIMSNKPDPSYLATSIFDEEIIRKDIRRTIAAAKANGLGLELLLKDLSTVKNNPQRIWRWSEIALEETMNSVL